MRTTEKKYWINAYQIRYSHTRQQKVKILTLSLFNIGLMISNVKPIIEFYKLI